ncbi:MAG TPA: 4-carboxy-4-hydroxy-2-oxoadipate aldolase/oxaloacetate decarboxylase [Caulobacteraceae bacterium]|nr:4-carboxy-4-hydroxy-2-oxoadipate aldolase/oxaloacetate decarboxylase [Caulobacteraceae bacterium]
MAVVVQNTPRTPLDVVDGLAELGTATVSEAQGRTGTFLPILKPIYRPAKVAGNAITCEVAPGDNWMIHVAVTQCQPGDILVVVPTSPCDDGYFGELLATQLMHRGVRGLIIEAGVRDIAVLTEMGFPVWSKTVNPQGTVKETIANVNTPIVIANQYVEPGDVVVADDDGVVVVKRKNAATTLEAGRKRESNEMAARKRYEAGALSAERFGEQLALKGLKYVDYPYEG